MKKLETLERNVIASFYIDNEAIQYGFENGLRFEFFTDFNRKIIEALSKELPDKGYVKNIVNYDLGSYYNSDYVGTIERFILHKRIEWERKQATELSMLDNDDDVLAKTNEIIASREELFNSVRDIKDVYDDAIDTIKQIIETGEIPGRLDLLGNEFKELGGGLYEGDLLVLGARPSMGKTTLAIKMATIALEEGKKVLFNSMDMTPKKFLLMFAASAIGITLKQLDRQSHDTLRNLRTAIITLKENNNLVVVNKREVVEYIMALRQVRPDVSFCDYLQLFKGGNDTKELSIITALLKTTASSLGTRIVALSQLSRASETRGGMKRPTMTDFRTTGAIEQDGDTLVMPYRPSVYGFETDDEGNDISELMEVIIVKSREGANGTLEYRFRNGLIEYDAYQYAEDTAVNYNTVGESTGSVIAPIDEVGETPF